MRKGEWRGGEKRWRGGRWNVWKVGKGRRRRHIIRYNILGREGGMEDLEQSRGRWWVDVVELVNQPVI